MPKIKVMADFFKDNNAHKSPKIKAIETNYKGYRMRSRLEARWAIFFDALSIKWEYEPEGFEFGGRMYLPDFYLPYFDGGTFVEVKFEATTEEIAICQKVSRLTRKNFLICEGTPSGKTLKMVYWGSPDDMFFGWPKFSSALDENRMWVTCSNIEISMEELRNRDDYYFDAVQAARSARFEHNEFKNSL